MSDGYRGYGYLPEMGGYGFFNPWMKSPDVAGGINLLTNIIAQNQALQQARQQQEWQRQMAEKEYALSERRVKTEEEAEKRLAQGQPERQPDWMVRIPFIKATHPDWPDSKVVEYAMWGREPQEREAVEKPNPQITRDITLVNSTIAKYINEAKRLAGDPELLKEYQKAIPNISDAFNLLSTAQNYLNSGQPLNKRLSMAVKRINSDMEGVKNGKTIDSIRKEWQTEGELKGLIPQQNIPKPPPGTPPGAKFERYDKDGSQLWRFPDGSLNRWR